MSAKKTTTPLPVVTEAAAAALRRLLAHPCRHPPMCGHAKFSECRNALVDAIAHEAARAGVLP